MSVSSIIKYFRCIASRIESTRRRRRTSEAEIHTGQDLQEMEIDRFVDRF